MSDNHSNTEDRAGNNKPFWDRHAKLSILLIAGIFYLTLIVMCAVVGVIVWRS